MRAEFTGFNCSGNAMGQRFQRIRRLLLTLPLGAFVLRGKILYELHALGDIRDQLWRQVLVLHGHHTAPFPFTELLEKRDDIALSGAEGHIPAVALA